MGKKKTAGATVVPTEAVADYRHLQAKRKNNPPAKVAAAGVVPILPKTEYAYVTAPFRLTEPVDEFKMV